MEDLEDILSNWSCLLKPSSRHLQSASTQHYPDSVVLDAKNTPWHKTESVRILGPIISAAGCATDDLDRTERQICSIKHLFLIQCTSNATILSWATQLFLNL